MTRDEILNMSASREMDALIAESVMGWKKNISDHGVRFYETPDGEIFLPNAIPYYSAYIDSAWRVIERLENQTPQTLCNISRISDNGTKEGLKWHCHLWVIDGANTYFYAVAETVPLAICAAALLAVMEKA